VAYEKYSAKNQRYVCKIKDIVIIECSYKVACGLSFAAEMDDRE